MKGFWIWLGSEEEKRSSGIVCLMTAKEVWVQGSCIRKILDENGLTESCLRYSDNEKPVVDGLFFNVSHAGDYVVGVLSDCEVGCDIEKNANAPLEVAEHYFYHSELAYIKAAKNKDKAFFTLWTLKEVI